MHIIKNFIIKNRYFIAVFSIIAILHLQFVLKNQSLLIFYGDSFEQQLQFHFGAWLRFKSFNFSSWDWTLGFGANYLSKIDNIVASPFLYLSLFFKYDTLPYLALYFYMIKMCLVYWVGFQWLRKIINHEEIAHIGAIILTFSGWVMFYYHYSFFLEGFIFYPLILSQLESSFKTENYRWVSILVTLLCIINFYLAYMFLPFAFGYFLLRNYVLKGRLDIREISRFILYLLMGVAMAAFVLLPMSRLILLTPRLKGMSDLKLWAMISKFDIFRYVSTLYSPVIERFDPSYFISTHYDKGIGWGGGVSLYSFILFPVLFPLIFKLNQRRQKQALIVSYTTLCFMALFIIFHRLLQGTHDVRWFYMFTLLNVYTIVIVLEDIFQHRIRRKWILISLLLSFSMIAGLLAISLKYQFYASNENLEVLKLTVLYAISLLILYTCILTRDKVSINLLLCLVLLEGVVSYSIPLTTNPPIEASILKEDIKTLTNRDAIEYVHSIDQGFYRIIKDNQGYLNQNEPFAQNYMGISFYSSVYNFEQQNYLNRFNETYSIPVTMGRDFSYFTTSVKYFISESKQHTAPLGFEFLETIGDADIYQNKYFLPVAYLQDRTLNEKMFMKQNYLNQDRLLLNHVVLKDSENIHLEYINQLTTIGSDIHTKNYFFGNPDIFKNCIIYIENKNLSGVTLRSSHKGEFLRDDAYQQYFYLMKYFDLSSKVDAIEILIPNAKEDQMGYDILLETNLDVYDHWYETISDGFMNVESFKNNEITGTIQVSKDSWLVTSIPFDSGWHAFVDDQEIEIEKVNLGFIGFPLTKGEHALRFAYSTPLFKEGLSISAIALFIFMFLTRMDLRRHVKSVKENV